MVLGRKRVLLCVFLLAFSACGGVGGVVSSVATGTGSSDTGATDTASSSAPSEEASLYESGPIDLPVTIAKLDGIDSSKIVVSVEPVGTQSISVQNRSRFVDSGVEIIDECNLIYTVTGLPTAVADPNDTPYVLIYNATLDIQSITDVESNGGFEGQICGRLQDKIVLGLLNPDQTESSAPLIITVDEKSGGNLTIVITDTNSDTIETDFNTLTDQDGNAYYVLINADGTSDFYRRPKDGSQLQTIWQDNSDIPQTVGSIEDNWVVYFNQDGVLKQVDVSAVSSSANLVERFLGQKKVRYSTLTGEAVSGYDIGVAPGDDPAAFRIDVVPAGDGPPWVFIHFSDDGNLTGISGATFSVANMNQGLQTAFVQHDAMGGQERLIDYQSGVGWGTWINTDIYGCDTAGCIVGTRLEDADEEFVVDETTDIGFFNLPETIIQVDTHPVDYDAAVLVGSNGVYSYHDGAGDHFGTEQNAYTAATVPPRTDHTCATSSSSCNQDSNCDGKIDLCDRDSNPKDGVDDNNPSLVALDTSGSIKRVNWSKNGRHLLGCKLYSNSKHALVCYNESTHVWDDVIPEDMRESSDDDFCLPTADITTTEDNDIHIWWPQQHSIIYYARNKALQGCYMSVYNEHLIELQDEQNSEYTRLDATFLFCNEYEQTDSFSNWDDFCNCFGSFQTGSASSCNSWESTCNQYGLDNNLGTCADYLIDQDLIGQGL